ncbi:HK97 gp10 family phage protein [Parablautia intestinalis]|uniref:HK97 gp10 family phage protein n=1 Tax=Parablautia intestinalis TaxID=2320100 RepID=UPI00256EDEE4|nr:HK97 gp10 family phage protein [Parablautia intestinalis]
MSVEFTDNSIKVKGELSSAVTAYLHEAAGELAARVKRNSRVDTGHTKGSWSYAVNEDLGEAVIGSPTENAIWEEFGTGEYALSGNGRKGGWYIPEEKLTKKAKDRMKKVIGKNGKVYYFTMGKRPTRALYNAFIFLKSALIQRAEDVLKARFSE